MTIRQFDVVANPLPGSGRARPYLICVQHRRLDHLQTRILAPLISEHRLGEEPRLNPTFVIAGKSVYLDPTDLVTLLVSRLGEAITNLESERDRIIASLDLVFTGI